MKKQLALKYGYPGIKTDTYYVRDRIQLDNDQHSIMYMYLTVLISTISAIHVNIFMYI